MAFYSPDSYSPTLFNSLPLFEDARSQLTPERIQKDEMTKLRELFHKYSVQSTFALVMIHRHFDLEQDEKLIEYRGISTPWKVGASASSIFGYRIVPRSWAFVAGAQLHPTEFRYVVSKGEDQAPEFPAGFVREFYELLSARGLERLVGLTAFGPDISSTGVAEVERTVGRVSLTIPPNDGELAESTETAWSFGCHESLNDSKFMRARVCLVCQGCK